MVSHTFSYRLILFQVAFPLDKQEHTLLAWNIYAQFLRTVFISLQTSSCVNVRYWWHFSGLRQVIEGIWWWMEQFCNCYPALEGMSCHLKASSTPVVAQTGSDSSQVWLMGGCTSRRMRLFFWCYWNDSVPNPQNSGHEGTASNIFGREFGDATVRTVA
jgi:hypothetical protein